VTYNFPENDDDKTSVRVINGVFMNGPPIYRHDQPPASSQLRRRKSSESTLNLPIFGAVWRISSSCWNSCWHHHQSVVDKTWKIHFQTQTLNSTAATTNYLALS